MTTIESNNKGFRGVSSFGLHILAMVLMLCDHAWATLFPMYDWLTCIGRIAFPIFAFMIVEGYFHTHDVKRYMKRLLVFALISEIPFDLMYASSGFYPFHQNVIWTFLIALILIRMIEKARAKGKTWLTVLTAAAACLLGLILGTLTMVDYYGAGVLTVLVFYLFHGRAWWCYVGQFLGLYYINVEMLGGFYYPVTILGHQFELMQQGLALLALIPIWLYRGRQGYHKKWFQYFCYGFYPGHMLVLFVLWQLAIRSMI